MATVVLKMSISLDGFVAPSDGSGEWSNAGRSPDAREWTLDAVRNASAHLVGSALYAAWSQFWPTDTGPFAGPMNDIPKIVISSSLTAGSWPETTIVRGDLAEAVTRLKSDRPDGYLLAQGGTRFARALVATGLIDEYRLAVHPVVLGSGERLFTESLSLEPISTTVFSRGAVGHTFTARP